MAGNTNDATVYFPMRKTREGEISQDDLVPAYLEVLAQLGGVSAASLLAQQRDGNTESNWSDYDNPRESVVRVWGQPNGDQGPSMRRQENMLFAQPGQKAGSNAYWIFAGIPEDLKVQGESHIATVGQGYARLRLQGDKKRLAPVARSFEKALASLDVLQEEDGPAVFGVEYLLGRSVSGLNMASEAEWIEPPLRKGASAVPCSKPAGASARYLLACIQIAKASEPSAKEAQALLGELAAQGPSLRFSHALSLVPLPYSKVGALGVAAEEKILSPPRALQAAEAHLLLLAGKREGARALLEELQVAADYPWGERVKEALMHLAQS